MIVILEYQKGKQYKSIRQLLQEKIIGKYYRKQERTSSSFIPSGWTVFSEKIQKHSLWSSLLSKSPPLRAGVTCSSTVYAREDTGWPASLKWRATGDFSSLRLMELLCSMMRVFTGLFVFPTYCFLHGQVMRQTTFRVEQVVNCFSLYVLLVTEPMTVFFLTELLWQAAHERHGWKPVALLNRSTPLRTLKLSAFTRKSLIFLAL